MLESVFGFPSFWQCVVFYLLHANPVFPIGVYFNSNVPILVSQRDSHLHSILLEGDRDCPVYHPLSIRPTFPILSHSGLIEYALTHRWYAGHCPWKEGGCHLSNLFSEFCLPLDPICHSLTPGLNISLIPPLGPAWHLLTSGLSVGHCPH